MNCELGDYAAGNVCGLCGFVLKASYPNGYWRRCPGDPKSQELARAAAKRKECPHLLNPTGDNVKQFGCGCPSESANGVDTAVFECELHDLCAPFSRGTHLSDTTVMRCCECPNNPANATAAADSPALH